MVYGGQRSCVKTRCSICYLCMVVLWLATKTTLCMCFDTHRTNTQTIIPCSHASRQHAFLFLALLARFFPYMCCERMTQICYKRAITDRCCELIVAHSQSQLTCWSSHVLLWHKWCYLHKTATCCYQFAFTVLLVISHPITRTPETMMGTCNASLCVANKLNECNW